MYVPYQITSSKTRCTYIIRETDNSRMKLNFCNWIYHFEDVQSGKLKE